ncbi:MAG: DUF222 domain-containing protein [Pseudonocardia sp.]|nr:DUF222 domain-containing protein [Pseudonocardia sp.]
MSQNSCPASARELLSVLRGFAAGQETTAGLDVDPVACGAELVALAEALAVITSAVSAAMVRFDRLDAGSPAALLVQRGHLTRTEAGNLRELGRKLDTTLPTTRDKLATGQIGVAQAKTIAQLDTRLAESTRPIPAEARRQVEAALAEHAASATTTETVRAAEKARYRLDPDTVEDEMRSQRDERGITVSPTLDGTGHLHGLLDVVSAAIWDGFFDRTAAPASPDDMRTAAARRLDAITDAIELQQRITATPDNTDDQALQESCNTQLAQPAEPGQPTAQPTGRPAGRPAGKAYQRPSTRQTGEDPATSDRRGGFAWQKTTPAQLMVIATHDLLTGKPGAEPAALADGTIIPADTARRYVCEATLNRVLLARGDEPLQLGRTNRLFAPAQVKAMIVRDRTCRWRGCEVPATRCTPHHAVSWSQGGTSNTENGQMLCPAHHRMAHEDRPPGGNGPPATNRLHAA